jgi:hypothetical protein
MSYYLVTFSNTFKPYFIIKNQDNPTSLCRNKVKNLLDFKIFLNSLDLTIVLCISM